MGGFQLEIWDGTWEVMLVPLLCFPFPLLLKFSLIFGIITVYGVNDYAQGGISRWGELKSSIIIAYLPIVFDSNKLRHSVMFSSGLVSHLHMQCDTLRFSVNSAILSSFLLFRSISANEPTALQGVVNAMQVTFNSNYFLLDILWPMTCNSCQPLASQV